MMDLFKFFSHGKGQSSSLLQLTPTGTSTQLNNTLLLTAIPLALFGLATQINWPRTIFRFVFGIVAPTKERFFPSDDARISPQARGLAWILLAGPPPPHDVQPIRTMMKYFWPNVWPSQGDVSVEVVPTPRPDSESLWICPPHDHNNNTDSNSCCLVHLHGGGMIAGTTGTERGLAVELARRLQVPVLSVDYRLVPENTVQEGVDDVVQAYQWLRKTYPHITKISFLGGSAGAGHSLLAAIRLRELNNVLQPTSLVLSSPGPGMEFLGCQEGGKDEEEEAPIVPFPSLQVNAPKDGYMAGQFYEYVTGVVYGNPVNRAYFRQQLQPSKLQLLADGEGPSSSCLVTAGSYEVILDGVHALVDELKKVQVAVTYKEYWKMQHCHFAFFEFTPESSDALDEIIVWLRDSWKEGTAVR